MKRARGDNLTGGTGDVNPQLLTFPPLTLPNIDTYNVARISLPIVRIPARSNKAIVMEVLKVMFVPPSFPGAFQATGQIIQSQIQLSTSQVSAIFPGSPAVFAYHSRKWKGNAGTEAYGTTWVNPHVLDLTDGAGHGVLIATDAIYFGADTTGFPASTSFNCSVLYRWKEVGLTEYLGMVSNQQVPGAAIGN